jgi:amino acid transporter/mannitol/fructose-specific phosphotransferase system IIA component (Ntr-type)
MMDDVAKAKNSSLKRALGLFDVFCIGTGVMIAASLFVLPGILFAKAGPCVFVSYLLSGVLIIPALLSMSELSTAMPMAGGNYFFIDRSMGPKMGMLGGLSDWFSMATKSAFALLGIGALGSLINLNIIQMKIIAIIFAIIFTIINLIGVKPAAKVQNAFVVFLLCLLGLYIVVGFFYIQYDRYTPFVPHGISPIFAAAGLASVGYIGLTKVVAVAEEIKNPARNIPLGMFLSLGVVSVLYGLVVFVTVGVLDVVQLKNSLAPISLGAGSFMGMFGIIIMAIAALLAYMTTANAGILSASRSPMAMGRDELLPSLFAIISKRGIPTYSIIFTSAYMIAIILFFDIEIIVEVAATLMFLSYLFVCLCIIIMRESKIRNYRPKFRSPFYPWIQIAGMVGYVFLIFEMGIIPLLIVGVFILSGLGWYLIYAGGKIKREYALLHVVERVTGIKSTNYLVDEELREILIERDNITEERFDYLIKKCAILDFEEPPLPGVLTKQVAHILKEDIGVDENKIFRLLLTREKKRSVMIKPGVIVPSIIIPGHKKSDIILVRCKKGITFSDDYPPANTVFIMVSTPDEHHFYLHALMWLTQIAETPDFETKWLNALNTDEMRDIILSSWRKQRF